MKAKVFSLVSLFLVASANVGYAQLQASYTVILESYYFFTNDGDQCNGPDPRWTYWMQDNVDGNRLGQVSYSRDDVANNSGLTYTVNRTMGSRTNTATRIDPWLNCFEDDGGGALNEGETGNRDIGDINFRDEDNYNTYRTYGRFTTRSTDGGTFDYGGTYRVTWRYTERVSAPSGVSATDSNSSSITVTWNAASQAERYDVYRHTSNNSGSATLIGNTTGTSYADSSASPGTTYYYWVTAYRESSNNSLVKSDTVSSFSSSDSGLRPKLDQTITFDALSARTFGDANFGLSASASSGLGVSFTSLNPSVATVSGSTVTIVGAGSATIRASQAGNSTYNAAPNVDRTLTVNKASQTISFGALLPVSVGDPSFNLSATGGGSGQPVTFSSSDTGVATVSGSTVTIVAPGSTTITASQAGNDNYNVASNVGQTLTVWTVLQSWRNQEFGSPDNSGSGADDNGGNGATLDNDMLSNFAEFAFGTDPQVDDDNPVTDAPASELLDDTTITPGIPRVVIDTSGGGSPAKFRYSRRKDYAVAGLTYTERFTDFAAPIGSNGSPRVLTPNAVGDYEIVEVDFPLFDSTGRKAKSMAAQLEVGATMTEAVQPE